MNQSEILSAMTQEFRDLAGFEADDASDLGIRMKVLAAQLELLYLRAEELEARAFPESSSGEYLDRHAAQRGLSRKAATSAQGEVRFSRSTPAPQDIPLPAGLIVSTAGDPAYRYVTTSDGLIEQGRLWAQVTAQAETPGRAGNASAGAVSLMITPVSGVSTVANPQPFTGGVDAESDDSLRQRLLDSYYAVSNGANAAYYRQIALETEGITSALVIPRPEGVGTVEVVVTADGSDPAPEVLSQLEERFAVEKEINVDVTVTSAQPVSVPISLEIQPEGSVPFETAKAQVEQTLSRYLLHLGVGQSVLLAGLIHEIYALPDVKNCRFLSPAADTPITQRQVAVCGEITVSQMEAVS